MRELTGWQSYKYAFRSRTYLHDVPWVQVGRPVVYQFPSLARVGLTEWAPEYLRRTDLLDMKRRAKIAKRQAAA